MAWWWYISAVNNKKYEKLVAVVKSWWALVQRESKLCWDTTFDPDLSSRLKITLSQMDNFRLYLTWPLYNIWHRWFGLSSVKHTSLASVVLHSQGDSPTLPGGGSSFLADPLIISLPAIFFFMILLHLTPDTQTLVTSFICGITYYTWQWRIKNLYFRLLIRTFFLDCSSGTPNLICPNGIHYFLPCFSYYFFLNEHYHLAA